MKDRKDIRKTASRREHDSSLDPKYGKGGRNLHW
jgi:hypothetical protein